MTGKILRIKDETLYKYVRFNEPCLKLKRRIWKCIKAYKIEAAFISMNDKTLKAALLYKFQGE